MDNIAPRLSTDHLSPGYSTASGSRRLFDNLNLSLLPGQLVCLMGPNGSGKSTLIRTLARLQKPLSGTVNGVDEKSVAVVLTDRVTSTAMSVYELITFGRYPYLGWNISLTSKDKEIIESAIARVNIHHLTDRKIVELSDGQIQMTMIARALAQETPVLLLDEPTAHLDLNNRVEIMNLLKQLTRSNHTAVLVATHEIDLALQTADLIWLATGSTIKTGIPEDLVLDGSLDAVFQLKGYDLKTGKVAHEPHRGITVSLKGSGPEYWWTKNALERNGFEVIDAGAIEISIENGLNWTMDNETFTSLERVLEAIESRLSHHRR